MDTIEVEYFYNADVLKYRCEFKEDNIGRITANNDIMNKTLLNVKFDTWYNYNKVLKEKIIQSEDKPVDGVSWMEVIGVAIDNRNNITFYKQFCNILHFKYELAELYFNSKYAKEDLLNLAKVRLEEILSGIEIPSNIKINYDYEETNNLQGNYRYFLGDVYISLYDSKTKIQSNKFSMVHLNETYDNGYHSRPEWFSLYQNEQNIRHMVKQFLKDMG